MKNRMLVGVAFVLVLNTGCLKRHSEGVTIPFPAAAVAVGTPTPEKTEIATTESDPDPQLAIVVTEKPASSDHNGMPMSAKDALDRAVKLHGLKEDGLRQSAADSAPIVERHIVAWYHSGKKGEPARCCKFTTREEGTTIPAVHKTTPEQEATAMQPATLTKPEQATPLTPAKVVAPVTAPFVAKTVEPVKPPAIVAKAGEPVTAPLVAKAGQPVTPPLTIAKAVEPVKLPVEPRKLFNSMRVSLIDPSDRIAIRSARAEVWITADEGSNWQRLCEIADRLSRPEFQLPGDGRWGVIVVDVDAQGVAGMPPKRGDQPKMWVEIDTSRPRFELGRVEPDGDALSINWNARDLHLGATPITLAYRTELDEPWTEIPVHLSNTGHYQWKYPEGKNQFFVRVQVTDEAGNATACETPIAIRVNR